MATPITTPRIVSAERSLLVRIVSSAMTTPSAMFGTVTIGYSARSAVIGIEPRGAGRGVHAEDDAGAGAEGERHADRPER